MKSSLSTLFTALALSILAPVHPANAQVAVGLKARIGLANLENLQANNAPAYKYVPGISKGVYAFANWTFAKHFSLNIDAGYSALGGLTQAIHPVWRSADEQRVYTDCTSDIQLHYLSTSFLLRYKYPLSKGWSIYLQAGPAPQLLVKAEQVDYGYGYVYESAENSAPVSYAFFDEAVSNKKSFHTWNPAIDAGVGVIWEIEGECAMLELGTSRGLRAIEKDPVNGKHATAQYAVTIGYGFSLNWNRGKK